MGDPSRTGEPGGACARCPRTWPSGTWPRVGGPTPPSGTWRRTVSREWATWPSGCIRRSDRGRAPSATSTGRHDRWPPPFGPGVSGPATSSCSSSRTGSRPASRSGRPPTSGPWSCPSSTSTGPRRSTTSSASTVPDVVVTADRFGHTDYLAIYETLLARPPGPAVAGRRATRRPAALPARSHALRRSCSTPTPSPAPLAVDPDCPGAHRLHLRHHPQPQGRGPLPPHHRLRDPPARPPVPHGSGRRRSPGPPSATSSGCSARSSSRCCGTGRSTSSTCGIPARCCASCCEEGLGVGGGATFFLTSLLDHPTSPPSTWR